ncbi:5'-nucleotidase-like isoform X2 [Centroberyx affinis]|uniref:5'-nucleotidase-like isoform X2 n=1 Tax=Centroberyx affinis TaxID=166261 RepID=UPI003A5BACB2
MSVRKRLCAALTSFCLLLLVNHLDKVSTFEVTLLHTNDNHARIEETSVDSGKCPKSGPCFAGVARRFTKLTEIRKKERNVLLLDAGDQFQGTVWFNYYKGAEAAYFMNKLGYDAMAFGNHEFDNGVEGLIQPFLQKVNCSMLSANIKADKTLAPKISGLYQPYTVLNVGSEKVAVIGYTTSETPVLSLPGPHLTFEDEVKALQLQVDKLETLGYNKIIALGHSGFDVDQDIAKRVRGIDVVIGGHTNTFLYTGSPPSTEVPAGPYPFMVRSNDGRNVPVVQAFAFGKYLGYLKVTFDKAGNVISAVGNPILMDSSIPQDPDVLADVEKWKVNLAQYSTQYVGQTLVYLNGTFEECRFRECNLGNLVCDAMIHHNIKYPDEVEWNHVGVCMLNSGTIRTAIDERYKNGIHVEFDLRRPVGERVVAMDLLCTDCRVPHYKPLDLERKYNVLVPAYIADGGDSFTMIKREKLRHNTGDMDITVLSKYISDRKRVYPAVEGRIKFRNSAVSVASSLALLLLGLGLPTTL